MRFSRFNISVANYDQLLYIDLISPEEQQRCELLEEQLRETTQDALKQRNGKKYFFRVRNRIFQSFHQRPTFYAADNFLVLVTFSSDQLSTLTKRERTVFSKSPKNSCIFFIVWNCILKFYRHLKVVYWPSWLPLCCWPSSFNLM